MDGWDPPSIISSYDQCTGRDRRPRNGVPRLTRVRQAERDGRIGLRERSHVQVPPNSHHIPGRQPAMPRGGSRAGFKYRPAGIHRLVEESPSGARSEGGVGSESPSQARMHGRLGRRLPLGGLLGGMAGVVIGALIGLLLFDRPVAILTSIIAAGVFGLSVGMLIAGYSSLESPDPGAEPSDTARPVADRPEAVRVEHPDLSDNPN